MWCIWCALILSMNAAYFTKKKKKKELRNDVLFALGILEVVSALLYLGTRTID